MASTEQPKDSSLSTFIERHHEQILEQWELFARTISSERNLDTSVLRDHAAGMLEVIAADLKVPQTPIEQAEKSQGRALRGQFETQAELHGAERAASGFSVNEAIAEFRALRASVLRLWAEVDTAAALAANDDVMRFNEAIDQLLAESIARFALEKNDYTRRFDALLSASPDLHYIIGADERVIYVNQALSNLLAMSQEQVVSAGLQALGPSLAPSIVADVRTVLTSCEALRAEATVPGPDGVDITYRYVFLPVLNRNGKVDSIIGTARNISELKASEEKTHRSAYYDSLTQLPNRTLFHDRLEQNINYAQRAGVPLALLFVDLDGFKEVNERSGHMTGDQLLQESARRMRACVRSGDTVARVGGDEFTVILVEINDILHIELLAQSILGELVKPFDIGGLSVTIGASMGITLCPEDGTLPYELLRNASQAMHVAKRAGGNQFSFFTAEMRDAAWARLKSIDELRRVLVLQQLEVYYQPIIDLNSGEIVKAEALVRWHHPQGKQIQPDAFIGLAEQIGFIGEIDSWVMRESVKRARQWSALLGRPFQISVNKSAVELMSPPLVNSWETDLDLLKRARNQIAVEITEGVLLNDSSGVRERLAMLKRVGVQLTIDDFGVGYSSLSYLKKFQVDFLKIDQSFVKDLTQSADSAIFAETIIVMAHKLGLKVIAEGVETVAQRNWLKAMACDYAQGFLFSAAAPTARFVEMLRGGRMHIT